MKKNFISLILLCGFMGIAICSFSQDSSYERSSPTKPLNGTKHFRTVSIGINGGALMPVAAIGGSNDFTKWEPSIGYGAYFKVQMTHTFGLQAEFLRGILRANNSRTLGDGSMLQSPYSSYKTQLNWSGSISGTATLGNINWLGEHNAILPYVSLGAGIVDYNPHLVIATGKENIDYKPTGSIKEFFIPVGAGIKANISDGINLDLGYRMNFVDGDNLDGYASGPHKDKFSYGFAGLEFALGNRDKKQLAFNNPAADMKRDLQDENNALKVSVANSLASSAAMVAANEQEMKQKNAQLEAMKNEIASLKKDSDGDGVADIFDKCAGTATTEKVDGSGCPLPKTEIIKQQPVIITEEDKRIITEAINDLQFDFGKATIRNTSYPSLNKVAEILVKKNFSLKLAGHTDNVGSESANLKLSKDRAESIKAYLVSQGANPSRIEATGYGETQPIASNKTEAGRQKNRPRRIYTLLDN